MARLNFYVALAGALLIIQFCLFSSSASAEEMHIDVARSLTLKHNGKTYTFSNLPILKDFPPEHAAMHVASDIDWKSDPRAHSFRTRLREGLKKGANFNGHYAIVTYGCGTWCQGNFVVNVENGKIAGRFTSTWGSAFARDSSLIIADRPPNELLEDTDVLGAMLVDVRFISVKHDHLIPIKTLNLGSVRAKNE